MWVEGPRYPSDADITIFRGGKIEQRKSEWDKSALYFQIPPGKRIIADGGLVGEPAKITVRSREHPKEMRAWIGQVLARQESHHTNLKNFNILGHRFRHGKSTEHKRSLHKMAVEAVSVILQYHYENGNPPFDVTV